MKIKRSICRAVVAAVLVAVGSAAFVGSAGAQQLTAPHQYVNPVQGAAHRFSAVFGEMRTDHFHSGIDFKTDGAEGKRIVAAADGYVSRIGVSTTGFGICLYVTHPALGTTTVYAHLSKFRSDIAKYVETERHRAKRSSITLYPTASQFRVKQGDLIGYSGNSGTSSGPHLHYEVREASTQRPLNPVTIGAVKVEDDIAPTVRSLHYVECQIIDGVRYEADPVKVDLVLSASGDYYTADGTNVMVGRRGYFVVGVTDRKNHVANSFGLYTLVGEDNGEVYYSYRQDGFLFSDTRYVNGVSYYAWQRSSALEYYRMIRQDGVPRSMFEKILNDGYIMTTYGGEQRDVVLTAGDDMGNKSSIRFTIEAKRNGDCMKVSRSATQGDKARFNKDSRFTNGALSVMIPSGALYSSVHFFSERTQERPKDVAGSEAHSDIYSVMDYNTPLHKAMEISIEADIADELRSKVVLVQLTAKGSRNIVSAKYAGGRVTGSCRSMGRFYVATDTVAPTISLNFKRGANLRSRSSVVVTVKDNFSGVGATDVYIDGKWMPMDKVGSNMRVYFNSKADGKRRTIRVVAKDKCGNESSVSYWYIR